MKIVQNPLFKRTLEKNYIQPSVLELLNEHNRFGGKLRRAHTLSSTKLEQSYVTHEKTST